MPMLPVNEIATVVRQAGFTAEEQARAIATALAASGGNPNHHDTTNGEDRRGLFAVNVAQHAYPEYEQWNHADPIISAQAARSLVQRIGWDHWADLEQAIAGYQGLLRQYGAHAEQVFALYRPTIQQLTSSREPESEPMTRLDDATPEDRLSVFRDAFNAAQRPQQAVYDPLPR